MNFWIVYKEQISVNNKKTNSEQFENYSLLAAICSLLFLCCQAIDFKESPMIFTASRTCSSLITSGGAKRMIWS